MKKNVKLVCEKCLQSNYTVNKSKLERIEVKKFCRRCNAHTIHKES